MTDACSPPTTLLLAGHGSRNIEGNDEIEKFAEAWRQRRPGERIEVCFIEHAEVLIDEGLDPIITASLDIARGAGRIPPPTGDVGELDIAVEYVSTMALAMKAVGVTNIERALTFAGTLLPNFQDVTEVVDGVGAVRTYFEKLSVPPTLLRSQEEVEARRAADAKVAEQRAQLANAQQAADAARKLGNTPMPGGESALSQLLSNIQPPLAAGEGNVQ